MAVLNAWQLPSRVISTDVGDGSDGALTISANTTEAPIDSSCSGTSGTTSLSATNASFAAGQVILIHQTRGTGVGQWEINKISSYTAGTITTSVALNYSYTDSGSSQAQVRVLKQHSAVTIDSTKIYTGKAWDGDVGGILGWLCNGGTTITGSAVVTGADATSSGSQGNDYTQNAANGGGFRGGYGYVRATENDNWQTQAGEGSAGAAAVLSTANGSGGEGGQGSGGGYMGAGGGHAATGGAGTGGTTSGGSAVGSADLTSLNFGGGGGGGVRSSGTTGIVSCGSNGGGIIVIYTKNYTVTGTVNANSGAGLDVAGGDGGNGAGGSVLVVGDAIVLGTSLVTATGSTVGDGGDGSTGRIAVHYKTSVSGTTSPTYDSTVESTLIMRASTGFLAFM